MELNLELSVVEIIQNYVNEVSSVWCDGDCKPSFIVSICTIGGIENILLTIEHLDAKFTEVIFPRKDCYYGYESIKTLMDELYNRTM